MILVKVCHCCTTQNYLCCSLKKVHFSNCLVHSRWFLRFEFQLSHPIQSPALATDKKMTLKSISHLLPKLVKISRPKASIFSLSKFIFYVKKKFWYFQKKKISLKNIVLRAYFVLLRFGKKRNESTLFTEIRPTFFSAIFLSFGNDSRVIFLSLAKVVLSIGCGSWYSNLKRLLVYRAYSLGNQCTDVERESFIFKTFKIDVSLKCRFNRAKSIWQFVCEWLDLVLKNVKKSQKRPKKGHKLALEVVFSKICCFPWIIWNT